MAPRLLRSSSTVLFEFNTTQYVEPSFRVKLRVVYKLRNGFIGPTKQRTALRIAAPILSCILECPPSAFGTSFQKMALLVPVEEGDISNGIVHIV